MADLITAAQFTDRTGRTLSVTQTTQVAALITDASALAIDIVGDSDITDTWDADTPGTVPASVVPVVVAMVRRGLDNPHGFTSEATGSYSYSGPGGTVLAERHEVRAIRKAAGTSGVAALNLNSYLPEPRSDSGLASSWLDGAL